MEAVQTFRLTPVAAEFNPRPGSNLNPAAAEFYPAFRHCHGKHVDGEETRVSKYQIRRNGDSGRRGLGRLHPPRETKMKGKYRVRRAIVPVVVALRNLPVSVCISSDARILFFPYFFLPFLFVSL